MPGMSLVKCIEQLEQQMNGAIVGSNVSVCLLFLHLCLAETKIKQQHTDTYREPQYAIRKIAFAENSRENLTLARSSFFYRNSGKN